MASKVPLLLRQARAYWRVAAKFDKQGNYAQGTHYRSVGDRFYRHYQREYGKD